MQLANTENANLHSFKMFVAKFLPTDLLLLRSLIICFALFTEQAEMKIYSLVVSDLRSKAKGSRGSSPAASYAQR